MANTTGSKYGGRKKGTPNKINLEVKKLLQEIVLTELGGMEERLNNLSDKERLDVLAKVLKYILPTAKEIDVFEEKEFVINWKND